MTSELVFRILIGIATGIGLVIGGYLIPYLRTRIGADKFDQYLSWAKKAVEAAEMIFVGDVKSGPAKKEYCLKMLTKIINSKKEILTAEQLDMLIEAAVKEMHIAEEISEK